MDNVLRMAGKTASGALYDVSFGETLMPLVGYLKSDNTQTVSRLIMGSVDALALGEKKISELDDDKLGAVLVKDGFVTLDTGKTDALVVDVRFARQSDKKLQMVIPYRNAQHEQGFAVHRLKLSQLEGIAMDEVETLMNAFMAGMDLHTEGAKIWQEKYVDQAGTCLVGGEDGIQHFSVEEFEALKKAPILVFFLVAAADGKVDKKETLALLKILSNPSIFNNSLLTRIITNIITELHEMVATISQSQTNYLDELERVGQIVDQYLSADEANDFKISLFILGKEIAESSGGFFGFGSKVSKAEKIALANIWGSLGIKGE